MCKKMWQSFLSVTVAIAIIVTSFLSPVHADEAADVASILTKVNQIYSRLGTMNTKMSYGGQDFTWFLNEIWGDTLDISTSITQFEADITVIQGNTQQYIDGDPTDSSTLLLATSYWEQIVQLLAESYNKMNAMNATTAEESQKLTQIVNALAQMHQDSISIAGKIDSITSFLQNKFNSFDIPLESLNAYLWFSRFNLSSSINTNNNVTYPRLSLSTSQDDAFNSIRRVQLVPDSTFVISFIQYNNASVSSNYPYFLQNEAAADYISVNYHSILLSSDKRLHHIIIKNSSSTIVSVSFDYVGSGVNVIPLYFGFENLMSEEMRSSIMYYESESNWELTKSIRDLLVDSSDGQSWLQKIYNHLIGDPDSNNKTQQDIDSMNDKVSDIQDSLDNYSDQLDQNLDHVNPSSLWQNISSNSSGISFLSDVMQEVYLSFGNYSWLFLLPLVFGLIVLFLG